MSDKNNIYVVRWEKSDVIQKVLWLKEIYLQVFSSAVRNNLGLALNL